MAGAKCGTRPDQAESNDEGHEVDVCEKRLAKETFSLTSPFP